MYSVLQNARAARARAPNAPGCVTAKARSAEIKRQLSRCSRKSHAFPLISVITKPGGDFPRAVALITSLCSYATVSRATPYRNSNISG